jgi:hypothetical protein
MLSDILSLNFPAGDVTDGQHLYRTLGSFWSQIFQDRNELKGYTTALAEEVIQSYYNLIETVNQYSVKDIDLFHKEKWLPLVIKKSEYNKAPFVYSPNGAVFGYQPESDLFYANQLFRFGFPKETLGGQIFSFTPKIKLSSPGLVANRVIAPSLLLIPGVDVVLNENTLYFKTDLFNNEYIPKAKVVEDLGKVATYKTSEGELVEDEFIVLWMYMASVDDSQVYKNFGTIFDINLPTSESYKNLLGAIINLQVEGATITALNSMFAMLVNAPVAIESREVIEHMYSDERYQYAITDKHVYKIPADQYFRGDLNEGSVIFSGEPLTEHIQIVDTAIDPLWWKTELYSSKLGFPSHVFAANTEQQLFFVNTDEVITYLGALPAPNNRLVFPVEGRPEDVQAFQDYINQPARKQKLLQALQFKEGQTTTMVINPVDFLFVNIFKNNTLLLKLDFYNRERLDLFFSLFSTLQPLLPAHVFTLVLLKLQLAEETMTNLNSKLRIPGFPDELFSIDGSSGLNGSRPGDLSDPDYYKDYINRLFCVSLGPYRNGQPLHADGSAKFNHVTNIDEMFINNNASPLSGISTGALRTDIPLQVKPPGELFPRTPSTREVPSIFLIDF